MDIKLLEQCFNLGDALVEDFISGGDSLRVRTAGHINGWLIELNLPDGALIDSVLGHAYDTRLPENRLSLPRVYEYGLPLREETNKKLYNAIIERYGN